MCKIDTEDLVLFSTCFKIVGLKDHYFEIQTKTGQFYCIYREDEETSLLLHKHHEHDKYHTHRVTSSATAALSEVLSHEKYLIKRRKEEEKIVRGRKFQIIL